MNLYKLSWTNGEKYERTKRIFNGENKNSNEYDIKNMVMNNRIDNDIYNKNCIDTLYNSNIKDDNNFLDVNEKQNKREMHNEKLSSRDMLIQSNTNPFFKNTNYIDHLNMEEQFLRPQDSNYNKSL